MNHLRWNNAQRPQGKSVEPSALHSGQGLEVKKRFSLPVEGEVFSLTFPFIDQAILNAARLRLIELFRQGLTQWRSATGRSASAAAGVLSRAACANVAKKLRLAARLAPSVPFPSATAPI